MSSRLWSICIPTLASRREKLAGLLDILLPQAETDGIVEVVGLHNHGELPLSRYRDALLASVRGRYVSFVDDDDMVSPDFVYACTEAMITDPDIVTFDFNYYSSRETIRCVGDLDYGGWYDQAGQRVRDVTHLFPARTSLAQQCTFGPDATSGEDVHYAERLRPLLRTQESVGRVLYHYRYNPADSAQATLPPQPRQARPEFGSTAFRWTEMEGA